MNKTSRSTGAATATTVHRLAVLLQAGVSPGRAWQVLADAGDTAAAEVVATCAAGGSVADALAARGGSWRHIAATWHVAQSVGAPLADSLRAVAAALRDGERTRDDIAVALAEPAATARLLAWLPLVAVALALLLGFDLLAAVTQPLGAACLVLGGALMVAARRWTSRLVAAAQPDAEIPGLQAEITAIALSGGVSIGAALRLVADSAGGDVGDDVRATLRLSHDAGAPAAELLRAEAAAARERARTDGRLAAARVGARLLLPLGACTLPSFLLLGVGPMLLSVLGATPLVF